VAIKAERLEVEVTANTKPAEKGLGGFSKETEKSSGGMKALKAATVAFAGSAAVGMAGKAVMAASDLNETLSKTGVVFKDQTGAVTTYAQQMADKFGLPKTAVLDAASSFGLLGKAAGISGPGLSKMSTGLAGLAADASSFYNVPLDQALGDFTSALSGESEPVKKYGVLMNEAAVQTEALALGLVKPVKNTRELQAAQVGAKAAQMAYSDAVKKHGKNSIEAQKAQVALAKAQDKVSAAAKGSVGPLTEGQKVQARASLLTKSMADASGDLARTQDSVSNRIREVQGRIVNYAADIGQKALPAVASLLDGVVSLMGGLSSAAGFIREHSTLFKVLAGIITGLLLPRIIAIGVQSTISAAKSTAAWVKTQAQAIASSWAQIGAGIKVVASWVAMGVAATVNAAKMAAAWVVGVIRQAAVSAAAMAVSAARVVAGWVLMGVQSMIQAAKMAAAWLIAMGPIAIVIAAVIGLAVLIYKNWDTIVAATKAAWSAVVGWVKGAWQWLKTAVVAYFTFYRNVITGAWNAIKGATSAVWNGIKAVISGVASGIRSVVSGAVSTIKGVVSGAWNWIRSTTTSTWNGIKSGVSRAVGGLLSTVRGIPGRVRSALGNLAGLLTSAGRSIMAGLARGIWDGLGNVTGAVRGVLSRARNLLPFSPAKEGPFSGRGWTLHSGRSISAALAKGIGQRVTQVRKAALGLAQAAVPPTGGATAPGVAFAAYRARSGVDNARARVTPDSISRASSPGGSQTVVFNTYYPVAEKQSQTVNRSLQKVAALQTA
jgi:phage-related protein